MIGASRDFPLWITRKSQGGLLTTSGSVIIDSAFREAARITAVKPDNTISAPAPKPFEAPPNDSAEYQVGSVDTVTAQQLTEGKAAGIKTPRTLIAATVAVGVVMLLGLLACVVLLTRTEVTGDSATAIVVLAMAMIGILGLTGCGALASLAYLVRRVQQLSRHAEALDHRTAVLAEQSVSRASGSEAPATDQVDLSQMESLLTEIREVLLLPEEQRNRRFRKMVEREFKKRLSAAESYIESGDFHHARQELGSLSDRFGHNDQIRDMAQRLEAAADAARSQDIDKATQQLQDLMGMGHWQRAISKARELSEKYPDSREARNLLDRVHQEREHFEKNHRHRMHEEIQQFVKQKRWREAAGAAERFIETFPEGSDADALRAQIETLKSNAEIEIRQQLEEHIKGYISKKKYWDAVELARRIIAEYPFSPQANALRTQLPRLENLAQQQRRR
jgi:hypothetical protein